jgi:hypothetical protein
MVRKKSINSKIPWDLHIAIVKLQGKLESTYEEACIVASQLMDVNSEVFEKAVSVKVRKIEKSKAMSTVNKSRKTWTDKGYQKGYSKGIKEGHRKGYQKGVEEYMITYPCNICNRDLVMKPGEIDHVAMKKMMTEKGWGHNKCHEANKSR